MSAFTRFRTGTIPSPKSCSPSTAGARSWAPTLGNDVNLRDVEGRSALLLGKAKDNNASASIGPFIRLFDDSFGDRRRAQCRTRSDGEGEDGFVLDGTSSMSEISRDPLDRW